MVARASGGTSRALAGVSAPTNRPFSSTTINVVASPLAHRSGKELSGVLAGTVRGLVMASRTNRLASRGKAKRARWAGALARSGGCLA